MTLVPLYSPYPYDMNATVINSLLSRVPSGIISQLSTLADVGLIDIYGSFVKAGFGPSVTCDGCHPTDTGYQQIAETMAPILQQARDSMI